MTPGQQVQIVCANAKDKVMGCFNQEELEYRGRSISKFFDFKEIGEEQLVRQYDRTIISVEKATEPTDIIWRNLSGHMQSYFCRRLFLWTVALSLLLFVTTPTVLFAALKSIDPTGIT